MRLLGMSEVRLTADSDEKRIGGEACPEPEVLPGQGRIGWLETECPEVHVSKSRRPASVLKGSGAGVRALVVAKKRVTTVEPRGAGR